MSDVVVVQEEEEVAVELVGTPAQVLDGALQVAIRRSVDACVAWSEVVLFGDQPSSALAALRIAYLSFVEVLATERPKGCPPSMWGVVEQAREFFDNLPEVPEGADEPEWSAEKVLELIGLCDKWRKTLHLCVVRRLRRLSKRPGKVGKKARKDLAFYKFGTKVIAYTGKLRRQEKRERLRKMKAQADLAALALSAPIDG
jgi:hypothetical protein